MSAGEGDVLTPKIKVEELFKAQLRYFLSGVESRKMTISNDRSSLEIVKVLSAIQESMLVACKSIKVLQR